MNGRCSEVKSEDVSITHIRRLLHTESQGWHYALQLAGGPPTDLRRGSSPCQPFNAAGKRKGGEDERHLWPAFFRSLAMPP